MSTATETLYTPLTIANAPEDSKPVIENIQKSFGSHYAYGSGWISPTHR